MRITLDTNVLIAAFITKGTCHDVFEDVVRHHELVLSDYILGEFTKKMTTKLRFTRKETREAKALILERARRVQPIDLDPPPKLDVDDLPILGTAVSGQVHCLATGDKELLELGSFGNIRIVRPGDFWELEDDAR